MKKILLHFANCRALEGVDCNSLKNHQMYDFDFYLEKDDNPFKFNFLDKVIYKKYRYFLWLIIYHSFFYKYLKKKDPKWISSPHFYKGVPNKVKYLIKFLNFSFLLEPFAKILVSFKKKFNPYDKLIKKYDLIISFTGIKDPHSDDLCRAAKKLNIKILFIQTGWDNISSKPLIERPDYFGVWGIQSCEFLRSFHNYDLEKILLTGSPRLYLHKKKSTKYPFHKIFKRKKIILFIGCGENFYDYPLIDKLNNSMKKKDFKDNFQVIYKPHPVMRIRNLINIKKYKRFTNIYFWTVNDEKKFDNNDILSNTDFLISPYSTMSLEAYYYGIPVLNFYYNHTMHKEHDYQIYGQHINLFPIIFDDRNIETTKIKDFEEDFKKLIAMKKINNKKIFEYCCELKFKTFEESLIFNINKIL